jgi:hypothetical protein
MAHITVKDLPLDVELDRQAMAAIVGGSRAGREGRANGLQQRAARHSPAVSGGSRIVDYPPGFARVVAPVATAKS